MLRFAAIVLVVLAMQVLPLAACTSEGDSEPGTPMSVPEAGGTTSSPVTDGGGGAQNVGPGKGGGTTSGDSGFHNSYIEQYACEEPLPDAGDDQCLSCVFEHCCEGHASECLLQVALGEFACYGSLDQFRDCFEREIASGSTVESWYIVAECADAILPPSREWVDAGGVPVQVGSFPFDDNSLQELVECIVGSRPASADADGGWEGDEGRALLPRGQSWGSFYEEHCAEECFPSWR